MSVMKKIWGRVEDDIQLTDSVSRPRWIVSRETAQLLGAVFIKAKEVHTGRYPWVQDPTS
jgi:hypothetical protein